MRYLQLKGSFVELQLINQMWLLVDISMQHKLLLLFDSSILGAIHLLGQPTVFSCLDSSESSEY